ncbi:MAG: MMPL family transporter [Bacteroidetes bacterium]|nr:MMPL family transporter [Bacteroidota bacterium]
MSKLFLAIYSFFEGRKALLLGVFVTSLLLLLYFSSKLRISENIFEMLPKDKNSEQLTDFMENSKFSDRILTIIKQEDTLVESNPEYLIQLTDSFAHEIGTKLKPYVTTINFVTNDSNINAILGVIDNHLPVFLNDTDYSKIDSVISVEGARKKLQYNYESLIGPSGIGLKKFILSDPLGINFLGYKKLEGFQMDNSIELYDNHFITSNHRTALIFIDPAYPSSQTKINNEFFDQFNQLTAEFNKTHKGYKAIYFGAPAVAAGNSKQIRTDTLFTISITVVLLLLVIFFYFRKLTTPILVMIPVLFGALFALTIIGILKGSVSIISLGAGSLVLGIAINYSLHFLTHFKHHPDARTVIKELSFPMTIGSLTTIGGFLCLQFLNAPVLRDLGLFAALSLTGSALATLIFLPHFVNPAAYLTSHESEEQESKIIGWLRNIPSSKYFVWTIILATPILLYFAPSVQFESDMYKINYMSTELKLAEKEVNSISSYYQKSIFQFTSANTLEEALQASEKSLPILQELKKEGTISAFTSVSLLLPSKEEQKKRIDKWNSFWAQRDPDTIYSMFVSEGKAFPFKESAFLPVKNISKKQYTLLTGEETKILKDAFLNNFIEEKNGKVSLTGLIRTTPENTSEVYNKMSGLKKSLLFDRKYVTDQLVEIVNKDFNFITLWTSLLVLMVLFLTYGRIELALISFIPMVVTWIWILGIMAIFDIKFNIINIILSTLIFALGDDFCIFTTDGLQQEYMRGVKKIKSISTSITLSAITTIIGMGVLVFAEHPALNSIGLVSIVGILSVWLISQSLQPLLFNFLIIRPTSKKHEPYTFFNILKSIFAFSYFTFGALLISIIGIVLIKLLPGKLSTRKYIYHYILSKFAGSMIYIMFNVKKKIINEWKENFKKPAIIIANHSSFLDILLLIMLNPKLILLTNKWVWNSPVFGLAIRMAEYYPVAEGAENTIPELSGKVAEGYSVVVFPEGTRSISGVIARFHKGAFYLAENLKLDILPIIIHGAGYTMSKGHFYLKNGELTLKYLPRISPTDLSFGTSYSERAKLIGRYFRQEHKKLSEQIETPLFYKEQLFSNFIFKGPILEWYMKVKVRLEKNYEFFNKILPREGKILDIGCGYGFLTYLLGYTSKQRTLTGIDYDINKIEIAENGYLKGENVRFLHADITNFEFEEQDAIVLNDVLHYLRHEEQIEVLEHCAKKLLPSGMLVIRDGVREIQQRHLGTRITELFSTKILGFNKTANHGLHFITADLIKNLATKYNFAISTIDTSRLTSNIIFVLKKQS